MALSRSFKYWKLYKLYLKARWWDFKFRRNKTKLECFLVYHLLPLQQMRPHLVRNDLCFYWVWIFAQHSGWIYQHTVLTHICFTNINECIVFCTSTYLPTYLVFIYFIFIWPASGWIANRWNPTRVLAVCWLCAFFLCLGFPLSSFAGTGLFSKYSPISNPLLLIF